ncbi:type VI secretion system-associated FHA domain protein TagH [Pseudooceanicola sp. C21-150M6]|uniref:type VI secretion system-associated FHA domain protein TagH n=1 Tax=Pseudooceanicola sp. C21-150M6 TaxID=3434355 RepID=UPI003D7FF3A3
MALTLRYQSSGRIPGRATPVSMRGGSVTIGRGDENDMVLPDPDRMVSKRHCVIEDHGGRIVAIDLSTNGTFLNYGKIPMGKTPTVLNNGDILSIGPYELLVELAEAAAGPAPEDLPPADFDDRLFDGPQRSDAIPDEEEDFLESLLGDGARPGGARLVNRPDPGEDGLLPPLSEEEDPLAPGPDPHQALGASQSDHGSALNDAWSGTTAPGQIPDDWDDLISPDPGRGPGPQPIPDEEDPFATPTPDRTVQEKPVAPEEHSAPPDDPTPEPTATPDRATAPTPVATSGDMAALALLKSLGAEGMRKDDEPLEETMARLGTVLRALIAGTRDVLQTRASIKSEFRMSQTRITPRGNNPLKFSVSDDQAVEAMVRPAVQGYLEPVEAARQAMDDLRAHEVASMAGTEAALKGLLRRLSPAEVAKKIEEGGGKGGLLKGKKARYWEAYEALYAGLSDEAENAFYDEFGREFAAAYQDQLKRLKDV